MAESSENAVVQTVVYLLPILLAAGIAFAFIWSQANGASKWSDFYAKEIAMTLELARPGDHIEIDVHEATRIAKRSGQSNQEIFQFDTENNELCVSISPKTRTCYNYFNDVNVTSSVILGAYTASEKNTLILDIATKEANNGP